MEDLQYVFCAATLPTQARTGPARILRPIWQNAEWVSTPGLHRAVSQIQQYFKLVVPGEQLLEVEKLLEMIQVQGNPEERLPPQRVILFVNKTEHAWALSRHLREKGYFSYSVTSRMDSAKAWEIITRFQNKSINILIGTDLISRGVDFKSVDWVINVDFPENVLFYLHRLGRTGRAGSEGKVMSFYTIYEADLANAIQNAAEGKGSYQYCFSKKRSFRRRMIRAEERGTGQRMSAPKLHELRFDESRVDPHFRDYKAMEIFVEKLAQDEEEHANYLEEVYERPFEEIIQIRNQYEQYKRLHQASDSKYMETSMEEAKDLGTSLEETHFEPMSEEAFNEMIKKIETFPDSDDEDDEYHKNTFEDASEFDHPPEEDWKVGLEEEEEEDIFASAEADEDQESDEEESPKVDDYTEWKRSRAKRRRPRQ